MTKMNELISCQKDKVTSTLIKGSNTTAQKDLDDEIQMNLAPYMQTYLTNISKEKSCGCLPMPFERAAPHSWIRPCFDSEILENQFKINSFKQFMIRFRYALVYMMIVSAIWLIFLFCHPYPDITFEYVIFAQMFLVSVWILFLSCKEIYIAHSSAIAYSTALHLVFTSLVFSLASGATIMSHSAMACWVILVIYTLIPLQPYVSLIICFLFSIVFETILLTTQKKFVLFYYGFIIRILCHVCVHIIGFHILVMTHARIRGTFMKVGQRLLVRKQLEMEKQLKEKMIHSVMPPKVATWLLSGENGENNSFTKASNQQDFGSMFRPFNMNRMENVSILFADIVGFTKMSSNKTAEQIVDILNDLFERFDDLCAANGCEKISTLGDCYYCVSGCPEPRPDHAKCCVKMGLDMIDAIKEFDVERGEDVNMRVGVHTGTVLCGVVGRRRFKFDVWSNDVTFANKLESTGLPGRVHISEQTSRFLQGMYILETFKDLQGVKTYLIKARTPVSGFESNTQESLKPEKPKSTSNINSIVFRKSINTNHAPSKKAHYLSLLTGARLKFASLPNVLGSNNTLFGSSGAVNSFKWFSFSKLKNSSTSDVTSSARHRKPLEDISFCRNSIYKLEALKKRENEVSICSMNNSRNSVSCDSFRRDSIQQQIYLMHEMKQGELIAQRLNCNCNSSQSIMCPFESGEAENQKKKSENVDTIGTCFYALRKQSDLQLIKCVNDVSQNSYIVKVPLHQFTLFFKDKKTETEYRNSAHRIHEKRGNSPATLSTSRFNTYFDILVSGLILVCSTISLYLLCEPTPNFIAVSTMALLLKSVALFLCQIHLGKTSNNKFSQATKFFSKKIFNLFSHWYPWHIFGGILVSIPILVTLTDFNCYYIFQEDLSLKNFTFDFLTSQENRKLISNVEFRDHFYTLLILIGLIHFCNFTQLNFFMKSFLALITGTIYLTLIGRTNCQYENKSKISTIFISEFLKNNVFINATEGRDCREIFLCCQQFRKIIKKLSYEVFDSQKYYTLGIQFLDLLFSKEGDSGDIYCATDDGFEFLENLNRSMAGMNKDVWIKSVAKSISNEIFSHGYSETFLNVIVIIILVIVLNREFEISYRLSYYCNTESSKDKMKVQNLKNQADWLLENIIPKHVSIELKNRAKYCKTHSNVGIMFASIVNFNKLYDESYSGGKEYLRVLNELISDFDELLNLEKFKNVDKIKTIGSTFMGASGLNPALRHKNKSENEHIFELMNFALEMYRVLNFFNKDLLGFNLILRVGFNVGEVTAGVIGSSKLFYDIWGDAVNVASRMDTCGVDGRIQVPHSCLNLLLGYYTFEPRGAVYIKGKGDILVYLVKQ